MEEEAENDGLSGGSDGCQPARLTQSQLPGGKKRKVALYCGYLGAGYQGMARQGGNVKTIEGELEAAMCAAGAISPENAGSFKKVQWSRAARTDKGVSAVGQVVGVKMMLKPDDIIERINSRLPPQIRVYGYTRATDGFDAWQKCDRRRYVYMLPEWVFDPSIGHGRELEVVFGTKKEIHTEGAAPTGPGGTGPAAEPSVDANNSIAFPTYDFPRSQFVSQAGEASVVGGLTDVEDGEDVVTAKRMRVDEPSTVVAAEQKEVQGPGRTGAPRPIPAAGASMRSESAGMGVVSMGGALWAAASGCAATGLPAMNSAAAPADGGGGAVSDRRTRSEADYCASTAPAADRAACTAAGVAGGLSDAQVDEQPAADKNEGQSHGANELLSRGNKSEAQSCGNHMSVHVSQLGQSQLGGEWVQTAACSEETSVGGGLGKGGGTIACVQEMGADKCASTAAATIATAATLADTAATVAAASAQHTATTAAAVGYAAAVAPVAGVGIAPGPHINMFRQDSAISMKAISSKHGSPTSSCAGVRRPTQHDAAHCASAQQAAVQQPSADTEDGGTWSDRQDFGDNMTDGKQGAAGLVEEEVGETEELTKAVDVAEAKAAVEAEIEADIEAEEDAEAETNAAAGRDSAFMESLRCQIKASTYKLDAGEEARLNAVLKLYQGVHNFHNFTSKMPAHIPQAKRNILTFTCGGVVEVAGGRWVLLEVLGQSFVLHQIRKMVGLAVAVMRGLLPQGDLTLALEPRRNVHVPMAPALGLYLDEVMYHSYNNMFGKLHSPLSLKPFQAAADKLRHDVLWPHIAQQDAEELINARWLCTLNEANFHFSSWRSSHKRQRAHSGKGTS